MKLRYIRGELRYVFNDWPISLGLLAGLWLLTEAGTNIGMLVFGTEKTEWQSASGAVALFGVALAVFLVAIVQYSSSFELGRGFCKSNFRYDKQELRQCENSFRCKLCGAGTDTVAVVL